MIYKEASEILEAIDNLIGTRVIKVAKNALKKQVSRVPDNLNEDTWNCPHCGKQYETEDNYYYCPNCGQAIDWSGYLVTEKAAE